MIEAIAIRQYIVSHFIKHPAKSIIEQVNQISRFLGNTFIKGEVVFVKGRQAAGKIVEAGHDGYKVRVHDEREGEVCVEVAGEEITRRDGVGKNEILSFILSVTQETPFGRVLAHNVIRNLGAACIKREPQWLEEWEGQKRVRGEAEEVGREEDQADAYAESRGGKRERREEEKKKELLAKQTAEIMEIEKREWEVEGASFEECSLILSLVAFLSTFSEFFKLDSFKPEEFVDGLLSLEYHNRAICSIHSKVIKAISHERRKSGKEGLADVIDLAASFVYGNGENSDLVKRIEEGRREYYEEVSPDGRKERKNRFTRIQWFNGEGSMKSWVLYPKSFFYDIIHLYELKGVVTNEFDYRVQLKEGVSSECRGALLADRILFLHFLTEVCLCGTRFKLFFDRAFEEMREVERKRHEHLVRISRIKMEIVQETEGSSEKREDSSRVQEGRTHEALEISEEHRSNKTVQKLLKELKQEGAALKEANARYSPEIVRGHVGTFGSVSFYLVKNQLFLEESKKFYWVGQKQWGTLLEKIHSLSRTKSNAQFEQALKNVLKRR
jgi:Domain of unknown function (DUF5097)